MAMKIQKPNIKIVSHHYTTYTATTRLPTNKYTLWAHINGGNNNEDDNDDTNTN